MNKHPGNIIFRKVVEANKEKYRTSLVDHKALLSKSIVLAMRSQSPPGRFLTRPQSGNEWVEVGDAKALQKTSQALREGSAEEESRKDVGTESGPTRPSQDEMNKEVLRRALIGFSHWRGMMKKPEVALSSEQPKNEIMNSVGQAVLAADVPISAGAENISSFETDSASIEESTSTSFRDSSSIASEETHPCELAAATLKKCLAPKDEEFHLISEDESFLSPYSDTDCLEALELLREEHIHDALVGFLPEFPIDMDHGDDEHLIDVVALKLCRNNVWEL